VAAIVKVPAFPAIAQASDLSDSKTGLDPGPGELLMDTPGVLDRIGSWPHGHALAVAIGSVGQQV
jgi:hypothetical protein